MISLSPAFRANNAQAAQAFHDQATDYPNQSACLGPLAYPLWLKILAKQAASFSSPLNPQTHTLSPQRHRQCSNQHNWDYLHQGGRYDRSPGLYYFRNRGYNQMNHLNIDRHCVEIPNIAGREPVLWIVRWIAV